jgi:hypothetical protein
MVHPWASILVGSSSWNTLFSIFFLNVGEFLLLFKQQQKRLGCSSEAQCLPSMQAHPQHGQKKKSKFFLYK